MDDQKHYYMQFEPRVWLSDPRLSLCTPETRGVWIDLISIMHEDDRCGQAIGSTEDLARLARCSPEVLIRALTDLKTRDAADVTFRNSHVTVVNRRMRKEFLARKNNAIRVREYRMKRKCNTPCNGHNNSNNQNTPKPPQAGAGNFEESERKKRRRSPEERFADRLLAAENQ